MIKLDTILLLVITILVFFCVYVNNELFILDMDVPVHIVRQTIFFGIAMIGVHYCIGEEP